MEPHRLETQINYYTRGAYGNLIISMRCA